MKTCRRNIRALQRIMLIPVTAVCILSSGCSPRKTNQETQRPNIIFLMDDQHRWDALGIVNPVVKTPHLDKLAREGVFYDQAVCQAPMCIPSRYSMMLGLYPNQTGILRNERGIPDSALPNKPLPRVFRDAGYQTAGFGKTHWAVRCSTRGFEVRYIGELREEGAVMMIDADPEKKRQYDEEVREYGPGEENILGYIGRTSALPEGSHRDGWVFERCLDFIRRRDDDRPLFLYLSFLKPHAGHNVPAGYEALYDTAEIRYAREPQWDRDRSPHALGAHHREMYETFWKGATEAQWKMMTMRYYANCSWMDSMFGRTLEALDEKGLLDNALVIYISDHGEMLGERYYRFNKYCLYESSVRVPVILSGSALPEKLRGTRDHRPAEGVDVYKTLLHAAGLEGPDFLQGKDLLSADRRQASFSASHEREGEASFMWRTPGYKLILVFNRKPDASEYTTENITGGEFYDLQNDPQEWNNLYGLPETATLQEEMTQALLKHLVRLKKMTP